MLGDSKWVWIDNNLEEYDQYVYFRKDLIKSNMKEIEINISASNSYKLYVNNRYIGRGPSPCTPKYQYYDTYTIENNEKIDEFCFSVVAYNIGEKIELVANQNQGKPGFICEINEILSDGSKECVLRSEDFKGLRAPAYFRDYIRMGQARISNWSGFKEVFISEQEPENWKMFGYEDKDEEWLDTIEVTHSNEYERLISRDIPFLKEEMVKPVKVLQIEKNLGEVLDADKIIEEEGFTVFDATYPGSFPSVILDFGKEVVGYVQVDIEGFNGGNLSISYGESLDLMRVDTLIMSDKREVYEPYNRRAFRYLKITVNGCDEKVKLYSVKLNKVNYPYELKGNFKSSEEMFNKIWETSVYTAIQGTQDHFEDCPWREKSLWLGDARVSALVNYFVFNDRRIIKKCIKQFFYLQRDDGSVPALAPQEPDITNVDYCEYLIIMLYEYYFYTADEMFIEEVFPFAVKLMEWLESLEAKDGLIDLRKGNGAACFVDWANLDNREKVTSLNCLYYDSLNKFAYLCDVIGKEKDKYLEKANALRRVINEKLYDSKKGLYVDCIVDDKSTNRYSQQSNIIAIYCKVASEHNIKNIIDKIYSDNNIETIKGAFLLNFTVDALFEYGYTDKAYELIDDFWGEMIRRGATTWWETFNPQTPKSSIPYIFSKNSPTYLIDYIPVSHCHPWGSGPAFLFMKYLLGITPSSPGFKEFKFQPYTDKVEFCRGEIPTPYGNIKVQWNKLKEGKIEYKVYRNDELILTDK